MWRGGRNSMQSPTDLRVLEVESDKSKPTPRKQYGAAVEQLWDVSEAAQFLRIHPKTLRDKARRGVIPGIQVGRLWRFRASALNEWLDEIAS
jgi:excisionase family DNA binding protein